MRRRTSMKADGGWLVGLSAAALALGGCYAGHLLLHSSEPSAAAPAPTLTRDEHLQSITVLVDQPRIPALLLNKRPTIPENIRAVLEGELEQVGFRVVRSPADPHDAVVRYNATWGGGLKPSTRQVELIWRDQQVFTVEHPIGSDEMSCEGDEADACLRAIWARDFVPFVAALARSPAVTVIAATKPGTATTAVAAQVPPGAPVPPATFITGTPQRDAYALIVGIDRYRDIPLAATGALTDAERFAALARSTLGVPDDHIKLATADHASRGDVEKHLLWLKSNVPAGGRIYFYFSGHGAPDPSTGASYLLPYDGDPKSLDGTALSLPRVLKSLSETQAKDILVMLDSCFSGAGGRSVLPEGVRPLVHVRPVSSAAHVAVFAAATGAEISGSAPDGAGGLFSSYIAEGLGKAQADHDGDGVITLQELSEWVTGRVSRQARKDSREQTPSLVVGSGVTAAAFTVASGLGTK